VGSSIGRPVRLGNRHRLLCAVGTLAARCQTFPNGVRLCVHSMRRAGSVRNMIEWRAAPPDCRTIEPRSSAMNELRVPDLFDLDPFPSTLRDLWRPWRNDLASAERAPQIRIDLSETDNAFAVKAEIPGVKKEDIDVRIDGNQVTISAEVKQDSEEKKDGRLLRSERRYGYASRSFLLGSDVDQAGADAKYSNGVLELKLPKKAQSAGKKLTIA
jgi:HSP20 family protein